MTTLSTQPEIERRLAEIDARTRGAWAAYREDLRRLEGVAYADAEPTSWARLQVALRELDAERVALSATGVPH